MPLPKAQIPGTKRPTSVADLKFLSFFAATRGAAKAKVITALRATYVRHLAVLGALIAVLPGALLSPTLFSSAEAAEKPKAAKTPPAAKAAPAPAPKTEAPKANQPIANQSSGDELKADSADAMDDSEKSDAKGSAAGLPIPRFVSLRTNPINLRTGPGVRYPVDWIYTRRHLPVEIIAEYDTWRHIRDPDGAEGWVHQSMLSGKRTAVVTGGVQTLKRAGEDMAPVVATLEAGVIVNVQRCPAETGYCRVEVNGLQGWLKREQFWGVYSNETVQ